MIICGHIKSQNQRFEYEGYNYLQVTKDELIKANTLSQILPSMWRDLSMDREKRKSLEDTRKLYFALGCETYPNSGYDLITNYVSVEIKVFNHNKEFKAKGSNDTLNKEQKEILALAEYGSEIEMNIYYMYKPSLAIKPQKNIRDLRGVLNISILPKQEAEFTGANKGITNYFNANVINKIQKKDMDDFFKAVLNFSIDEEGKTKDIFLSESSSKAYIDKIILDATANMPSWKPAKNEKGMRVKQIFKIPFGGRGC
jgi:hypothetical protein